MRVQRVNNVGNTKSQSKQINGNINFTSTFVLPKNLDDFKRVDKLLSNIGQIGEWKWYDCLSGIGQGKKGWFEISDKIFSKRAPEIDGLEVRRDILHIKTEREGTTSNQYETPYNRVYISVPDTVAENGKIEEIIKNSGLTYRKVGFPSKEPCKYVLIKASDSAIMNPNRFNRRGYLNENGPIKILQAMASDQNNGTIREIELRVPVYYLQDLETCLKRNNMIKYSIYDDARYLNYNE